MIHILNRLKDSLSVLVVRLEHAGADPAFEEFHYYAPFPSSISTFGPVLIE